MGSAPSQDQKPITEAKRQPPTRKPSAAAASEAGSQAAKNRSGPSIMPKRPAPQKSLLKERLKWRKDPSEITTVIISQAGFSKTHISICAGQFVVFVWEDEEGTGYNVTQVVHDGDQFRPVPGGIHSGSLSHKGDFEYQFKLAGEYKFVSAGIRCTPLTVSVNEHREIFAKLEDTGFSPKVLHLEAGESVKWSWTQCTVPHAMQQASYCALHAGFKKLPSDKNEIATVNGSYSHSFKQAGMYYFMGSGNTPAEYHLCIVHVHDVFAEQRITITDRSFEPPILVVNAGDRVWFEWSRNSCQKKHNPYEIALPPRGARKEESFKLKKQGFRWPQPSRGGLMAHDFMEPGVFYFSDYNHQEAAAYVGTIIVKNKPGEHSIQLSSDGFTPDLLNLSVGERIWWRWDTKELPANFSIMQAGRTAVADESPTSVEACEEECQPLDKQSAESFASTGALALIPSRAGVYHYKVNNFQNSIASSTLIANPGSRNHTISIGDNGFEPKKLTIAVGDFVWWVWQKSGRLHNVLQVSHEGHPLDDGFQSGALTDPPCAFMHKFNQAGVYYYQSDSLRNTFGVVQCCSGPRVHEVQVGPAGLSPDPVVAVVDDVVAWLFKGLRSHDVVPVGSVGELLDAQHKSQGLTPRRCMERAFTSQGVFNFTSRSFLQLSANREAPMDESRISSVVVSERIDAVVVRLCSEGFFPASVAVAKGQTVIWDWTEAPETEQHNVAHVNPPVSDAPLSVIHGERSFNSGRASSRSKFLYTFNRSGMFCVASLGVPGRCGTVLVLPEQKKTPTPRIVSYHEGGTVQKNTVVRLECNDPKAQIYYTLDGTLPLLHRKAVKVYQTWEPLKLKKTGILFIRAMAVAENCQPSEIYTSKRFWVVDSNEAGAVSESEAEEAPASDEIQRADQGPKGESWKWFNCVPSIKLMHVGDNSIEVFWEPLAEGLAEMVAAYQIFLNGIAYCKPFQPRQSCFHVAALAAGRSYTIWVEVLPVDKAAYQPNRTNKLNFDCPISTEEGGPLISLELAPHKDTMTIVWAALLHTDYGLKGYKVTLNGRQCGKLVSPDPNNRRCKVVVEGCALDIDYQILVYAVKTAESDDSSELPSNKLSFRLPLDTASMVLPDGAELLESESLSEFVFVKDGLGYHLRTYEDYDNDEGVAATTQNGQALSDEEEEEEEAAKTPGDREKDNEEKERKREEDHKEERRRKEEEERRRKEQEERLRLENKEKELKKKEKELKRKEKQREEEQKEREEKEEKEREQRERQREKEEAAAAAAKEKRRRKHSTSSTSTSSSAKDRSMSDTDQSKFEEVERSSASSTTPTLNSVSEASSSQSSRDRDHRGRRGRKQKEQQQQKTDRSKDFADDSNAVVEIKESKPDDSWRTQAAVVTAAAAAAASSDGEKQQQASSESALALPRPVVQVTPDSEVADKVQVDWQFSQPISHHYRLDVCTVSIVGKNFGKVNSNISFAREDGVLHSWTVTDAQQRKCECKGLMPSSDYRVFVSAIFVPADGSKGKEQTTDSAVCEFSTYGPPQAPQLTARSVDVRQVTVTWRPVRDIGADEVIGYQLLIDGAKQGGMLPAQTSQTSLEPLKPGRTINVEVQALTRSGKTSEPSNSLRITCPKQPAPPKLTEQPSSAEGAAIVSWQAEGSTAPQEEDVSKFSIVVNGMWHGELKASAERRSYSYYLTDLMPGSVHEVQVKAIAGSKRVEPNSDHVYCLCESDLSEPLCVSCSAPPVSPELRVDALNENGLVVSWSVPQQFGEAQISGYQMLRDGQTYGSVIPPETTSFHIRDLSLGQRLTLQLVALTTHPVGQRSKSGKYGEEESDSQFSKCRPGPALVVNYTGLVQAPEHVWCDDVTGHSAIVAWTKESSKRLHFIEPDRYQVTWWPGETADKEVNSLSTLEDFAVLEGLKAATVYTVVVEARSHQQSEDGKGTVIVASKPQQLTIRTAQPPVPTSNLGVVGTTCYSLLLAWDPPVERGCEVISIRVECVALKQQQQQQQLQQQQQERQVLELMPDATRVLIENLREKTDYVVRVSAVTDEAFHLLPRRHPVRVSRKLPEDISDLQLQLDWMPSAKIVATTSGTNPPAKIRLVHATSSSLKLRWQPPSVTGSNRLRGQVVRWINLSDCPADAADPAAPADYISLDPKDSKVTLESLTAGSRYRITIEAVVSLKTALELEASSDDEQKNRRTAHVASDSVYARTRCHVTAPRLLVTALRPDSVVLYWERPYSMAVVPREAPGAGGRTDERHIRCQVEGYRLEINGKPYVNLKSNAQSCTLVKCKPGKVYNCLLVALSQTDEAKREAKRLRSSKHSAEQQMFVNDLDETWSEPLMVRAPGGELGALREFCGEYRLLEPPNGELRLRWKLDEAFAGMVQQFNITWNSDKDVRAQRRVVDVAADTIGIDIQQQQRCVLTARIECVTNRETLETLEQVCHVVVPGPPDAPRIFLDRVSDKEIVIEWSEPQLWGGVAVGGYQLYIDGKATGEPLDPSHSRAVVPCRPNRQYHLQLVALSAHADFKNSDASNTLYVNTNPHMPPLQKEPSQSEGADAAATAAGATAAGADTEITLAISACSDTTATVDWMGYTPAADVAKFALQWAAAGQAAERTETLQVGERSCLLQGLTPATVYSVRVSSLNSNGAVVDKSRRLRVQTCAPIEAPVVKLLACNFSYIAIQWCQPRTYGDTSVAGYKVFVNGVVEESLSASDTTYSFVKGKWCHEYSFQVQATCANTKFNSSASEPLVVTWPGCAPSELRLLQAKATSQARVSWQVPYLTEGVKVKQYRLICKQADSQQVVQVVGPLHPDTREAEVTNLKLGTYHLLLEVHLHGTQIVVYSPPLTVEPSLTPDPPTISVSVLGQEQRRQLDLAVTQLVNRRDRYIRLIHNIQSQPARTLEETQMLAQYTEAYDQTMDSLDECFKSLELFTGELVTQITWNCPQSNPDVTVSGYKIQVDGQQYGSAVHSGISSARIRLGADTPSHKITVVALCDSQDTQSPESNCVELLTEPFLPFAFFCIHEVHCGERYPRKGCCLYQESLSVERRQFTQQYNPGFLNQYVPAPTTFVQDIFSGEKYRLMPAGGPKSVTMLCFWTRWCLASQRYLRFFVRLAAGLRKQFDFVAVATQRADNAHERSALLHCVKENSFEGKGLRHAFCVDRQKASNDETLSIAEAFHITGVPFFVIVHSEGNVAWRGRHCAAEYSSFEDEMTQILRAVKEKTRLGDEIMNEISQQQIDHTRLPRDYEEATFNLHPANSFANGSGQSARQGSGKLRARQSGGGNGQISINTRPFSRPQSAQQQQQQQQQQGKRKRARSAAKKQ